LATIHWYGPITAAVIVGKIGDINRFERPNQLLALAGLDASVHQSRDFTGTKNRLSKRGSFYLLTSNFASKFHFLPKKIQHYLLIIKAYENVESSIEQL
jgi:transposase